MNSDLPTQPQASDLRILHETAQTVIESSTAQHAAAFGRLLQIDVDIKKWEERLSCRPEVKQLSDARRELGFAIYAAASGLYGLAYSGLRLFVELGFASIYFSAHELFRRKWVSDRVDFSWNVAIDEDSGVLSKTFVQEFNSEAVDDAKIYAVKAAKCYRSCSQMLHGKLSVRDALPRTLAYSDRVISAWYEEAGNAAEAVLFVLFCRYGDELLEEDDGSLSDTLEHSFSHLPSVRRRLQLPMD